MPFRLRRDRAAAVSPKVGGGVQVHPHSCAHSWSGVRGHYRWDTTLTHFSPLQVRYVGLDLRTQGGVCPRVSLGSGQLQS